MINKYRSIFLLMAIVSLILYLHHPAHSSEATNFIFIKIADFQTGTPQGSGNFTDLGIPSISEGKVAFWGASGGLVGIYLYDYITNQLIVVADENTLAPGGTGNFTNFRGIPSVSGGNIAFFATRSESQGIYSYIGDVLDVVADGNTWIPDGDWYFSAFGRNPSIFNDRIALTSVGVYTNYGGALNTVADNYTYIPDGLGQFTTFWDVAVSGADVTFLGSSSRTDESGIYLYNYDEDLLEVVADLNTEAPGGNGYFTGFQDFSISGDRITFYGEGDSYRPGIFLYNNNNGQIEVVADRNTPIPGRSENFSSFSSSPSISGDKVAFRGFGAGFSGIYLSSKSSIEHVIARGDIIDGRTVVYAELGREGLSDNQIAFAAYLNDYTNAIFMAIPSQSMIHFSENNHWYLHFAPPENNF